MSAGGNHGVPGGKRLDELFSKMCDGRLTEREMAELDAALADSAKARSFYRRYMNLHATLHTYLVGAVSDEVAAPAPGLRELRIPPARVTPIRAQPRPRVNPVVLAAAAAVIFGIGLFAIEWAYENLPVPGGSGAQFATLTQSIDARWAPGSHVPEEGKPLGRERLMLESGSIRINFGKGADVMFAGKADIEILSDNSARVESGRMLAEVPASASGFTVRTAAFDVIDLGTVFGVTVRDSGEVELSVLSGLVELAVKDGKSGEMVRIQRLRKWQSVVAHPGDLRVEKVRYDAIPYRGMRSSDPEE